MIRIDFFEPHTTDSFESYTTEWHEWRIRCDEETEAVIAAVEAGEEVTFKSNLYGRFKKTFYADGQGPFRGKCAFCESKVRINQHGDIEHFRPKGAVCNLDNSIVSKRTSGDDHPGYYWLAYALENLILSCELCNQPSTEPQGEAIGKRTYFPLFDETRRAEVPGKEVQEVPLLIHPMVEEPADYLGMDSTGVLFALEGSEKGQTTIDILGLNLRELPDERATIYEDTKEKFKTYFTMKVMDPESEVVANKGKRIEGILHGREPFTFAARVAVADAKAEIAAEIQNL